MEKVQEVKVRPADFHLLNVPRLAEIVYAADISVGEQRNTVIRLVHVLRLKDREAAQTLIDTCYEHIKDIPRHASPHEAMVWGDVLGKAGRFKAAVRALNIALEKERMDERTALSARRFRAEYSTKIKREDGLSNWGEGERLFEEIPEEARTAYYWQQRADVAWEAATGTRELGLSIERAKMYYRKALEIDAGYEPARVRLAEILMLQEDLDSAEDLLRPITVTGNSGHAVEALLILGQVCTRRADHAGDEAERIRLHQQGRGFFLAAHHRDPYHRRALELLRVHAMFAGDRDEEDRWKKALADLERLR